MKHFSMLRNTFIAFISGWVIWFWIDKPHTGLTQFLKTDDNMLVNFQRAFDLFKSGYLAQSYIYIWNAHYIVLSLIIGIILGALYGVISDYLTRKRTRKCFTQPSSLKQKQEHSIKKPSD
ncbi:MAG: hypothetical protein KAI22_09205 [Gammaproteobacteria bacterium]|nr:hypothetical protein [Gammaproteobacteria bacterium]